MIHLRSKLTFADRAVAATLAHACGDRFGASLEFTHLPAVRTKPVQLGNWTDDTHMSIYLAQAILAHGPGALDVDRLGTLVGEQFIDWLHDPLTPSTAPGGTCLQGARNFERSHNWRTCGVSGSDGCGAVMRIVPITIGFQGEELLEAARISAQVTHAHPNALEAAMAGAWILRQLFEGRGLAEVVPEAVRGLRGSWGQGGKVAESLEEAVYWAARGENWLDEAMIPPGDGGWRSGSALGLAVAAALRWGREPAVAIEKAARINGDSDSVACLAGALVGAMMGTELLPREWLATLPQRERLERLAHLLIAREGQGSARGASPLVVIGDLHGHLGLFEKILAYVDANYPDARIVTLGDYVDNGPQVRQLLDRLIVLKRERSELFFSILGNHDLALLRALGWPNGVPDGDWYRQWQGRYWNPGGGTPAQYGADSLVSFEGAFPLSHYRFLADLPWFYDDGVHLCVHAGMHVGALGPQREQLENKQLPEEKLFLPDAIRAKDLAKRHDPSWDRVVVSAHTQLPNHAFFAEKRVAVSATSDHVGSLVAVVLPDRTVLRADGHGVRKV
jgi:ADP-ribosylglycohydrolase